MYFWMVHYTCHAWNICNSLDTNTSQPTGVVSEDSWTLAPCVFVSKCSKKLKHLWILFVFDLQLWGICNHLVSCGFRFLLTQEEVTKRFMFVLKFPNNHWVKEEPRDQGSNRLAMFSGTVGYWWIVWIVWSRLWWWVCSAKVYPIFHNVLVATAGWCGRFQALASWGWIFRSGGFHVHVLSRRWRYLHPKSGDIKHLLFGQTVKPNGSLRVYKNWIRFGCYLFASRLGFPCYAGADHKAEGGRKEGTSKSWGGLEVAWTRLGEL